MIGAATKFQPVYVGDVAEAIANAAQQPGVFGGKTFELAGPQVMSMKEINAWVAKAIGRGDKPLVDVPGAFASLLAMLALVTLVIKQFIEWRASQSHKEA